MVGGGGEMRLVGSLEIPEQVDGPAWMTLPWRAEQAVYDKILTTEETLNQGTFLRKNIWNLRHFWQQDTSVL